MRRRTLAILAVIAVAIVIGALLMHNMMSYGFSAHDEPTRVEAMMAAMMRHYSAPADLREAKNPIPLTPEILTEARAHFAAHCATSHGNDGMGTTVTGPLFYPKPPDMTSPVPPSPRVRALFASIAHVIRKTSKPSCADGHAD